MTSRRVTFVLPGDSRTGGTRVTALMGNLLAARGWDVTIAHPREASGGLRQIVAGAARRVLGGGPPQPGWLRLFRGRIDVYDRVDDLPLERGQIVIAVGTFTVAEVAKITVPVVKVRYQHGFPSEMRPECVAAWSMPMTTITVSGTMVPELERLSGGKVSAVVPNGIDTDDYHVVPGVPRDAIGTIYGAGGNKAPEDIVRVMRRAGEEFKTTPRLLFGTARRPPGLEGCEYERDPPVERAREIYNRALVWFLVSRTEGLPGPVLEAMACGAAVVTSDNDGSLEIVRHGVNGLVVRIGDVEGFVAALRQVLGDGALRARLVENGFETVRRFTWDAAVARMEAFLRSLDGA